VVTTQEEEVTQAQAAVEVAGEDGNILTERTDVIYSEKRE
jgi:hypothetical protein